MQIVALKCFANYIIDGESITVKLFMRIFVGYVLPAGTYILYI
jgi:hypothetical protein